MAHHTIHDSLKTAAHFLAHRPPGRADLEAVLDSVESLVADDSSVRRAIEVESRLHFPALDATKQARVLLLMASVNTTLHGLVARRERQR